MEHDVYNDPTEGCPHCGTTGDVHAQACPRYQAPAPQGDGPTPQPLDEEELRLLRTYANGPRIWDAASVFAVVCRLDAKGYLEPSGEHGAYALTGKGRAVLQGSAVTRPLTR